MPNNSRKKKGLVKRILRSKRVQSMLPKKLKKTKSKNNRKNNRKNSILNKEYQNFEKKHLNKLVKLSESERNAYLKNLWNKKNNNNNNSNYFNSNNNTNNNRNNNIWKNSANW